MSEEISKPAAEAAGKANTQSSYPDTPEGWSRYWTLEIGAAEDALRDWKKGGEKIIKAFLDHRGNNESEDDADETTKLNFFWANVVTMRDMMFGRMPEVDVVRRFGDSDDDEARIGGPLILQRILNTDIENGSDGFRGALRNALNDFLLVGFGNAWVRYEAEFEELPEKKDAKGKVLAPAAPRKVSEDAPVDYFYWDDQLWSPCRVWEEMRWTAKRVFMTQEALVARFGKEIGEAVALDASEKKANRREIDQPVLDPWSRAEVWEIWSKEHRKVFWFVKGFGTILDVKDDFLKLKDFWPHPRPMFANLTTTALVPRADYAEVQDLYRDINLLATRITVLERALRVAGVYDRNAGDLQRLLEDNAERNVLIPVEGWGERVKDGGGLDSVISWLPLDQIVSALDKLTQKLQEKQQLLYELTGQSDLQRGVENSSTPDTATSVRAQVKYASVRVQARQDELARFASELQSLRAEVMVKHFEAATLLKRANMLYTPDAPQALQAVMMLKQEFPNYRVDVKPEAIAMTDFASMKAERVEFITAIGTVLTNALPLVQMFPPLGPVLIETLKWTLAGFRGSASIEGVWDKALKQAQQMMNSPQQQGPDPEVMKEFFKAQADMMKTQAKLKADLMKLEATVQTEREKQNIQAQANIAEAQAQAAIKEQERAGDIRHATAKAAIQMQSAEQRAKIQKANRPKGRPSNG